MSQRKINRWFISAVLLLTFDQTETQKSTDVLANTDIKWEKKLLLVCLIFSCELSGHFNTQSRDKPECMWRGDSVQTHSSSAHLTANTFTEVNIVELKAADQHRKIMCVNLVIYGAYILKCHNSANSKIFFHIHLEIKTPYYTYFLILIFHPFI